MFTKIMYALAAILLLVSFIKSKENTKKALKKAWKSFESIMPQMLAIILIIGMMLSWLTPEMISKIIGSESGVLGMIIAGLIGSITLIPAFVAFPLAAALYENGAGIVQIATFISTLMMVGIVTVPLEMKTFGKKITLLRNGMAFVFSFIIAVLMGVMV